jgi:Flp pilus assembly protein TadG
MVEMVFLLPVICLLIFAIAEFAIAFGQWSTINNAAREGARFAIVYRGVCDATAVQTAVTNVVDQYAAAMGGISPGDVTVLFDGTDVCGAAGTPATVRVTLPYNFAILPNFSSGFFGGNVSTSITLTGISTMRNEG